jgi:hypothetical protein
VFHQKFKKLSSGHALSGKLKRKDKTFFKVDWKGIIVELEFDTSEWISVKMNPEVRAEISGALESYISAGILFPEETRLVEDMLRKIRNLKNPEVSLPLIMVSKDMIGTN